MKTAEEWLETFVKTDNMVRGRLDLIRDIQSDALREAAEIADGILRVNRENHAYTSGKEIRDAILTKTKELK